MGSGGCTPQIRRPAPRKELADTKRAAPSGAAGLSEQLPRARFGGASPTREMPCARVVARLGVDSRAALCAKQGRKSRAARGRRSCRARQLELLGGMDAPTRSSGKPTVTHGKPTGAATRSSGHRAPPLHEAAAARVSDASARPLARTYGKLTSPPARRCRALPKHARPCACHLRCVSIRASRPHPHQCGPAEHSPGANDAGEQRVARIGGAREPVLGCVSEAAHRRRGHC